MLDLIRFFSNDLIKIKPVFEVQIFGAEGWVDVGGLELGEGESFVEHFAGLGEAAVEEAGEGVIVLGCRFSVVGRGVSAEN